MSLKPFYSFNPRGILAGAAAMALVALGVGACTEEYNHGYVQSPDALSQIAVGSSREQVLLVLGSPSATSTVGGESFYYISQKTSRTIAFMEPGLVDQRVLAVYFDEGGRVREIGNYGLQDGKIFDFISRRTKTTGQDLGLLFQLMHGGTTFGPTLPTK